MSLSSNFAIRVSYGIRRGLVLLAAMLVGCGGAGGGKPTTDLICRGDGVIVGGKVTFVKRLYDKAGLTGERQIRPVRYALVEMVLEIDGRAIGSTYTDANGNYCMELRGVPADFPVVYPRVATRTDPKRFAIAVVDDILNPQPNIYSRTGASFNGAIRGNYDRDISVPVYAQVVANADFPLAGAYNVLDVATTGAEAAIALTGRRPSAELLVGWTPGTVFGDGTVGTYFVGDDPTQRLAGIELSGGQGGDPDAGDHDEYDDDVILHEFGHFMAYSFSKPAEAGGAHYLNDNTQDIRLAWSEGWATFFSAAVRNSPVMVNTRGGDPGHPDHPDSYFFEIETPHAEILSSIGTPLETHGVYTTSEVAVASVLWDLYDSRNEAGDSLALGLRGVWDVFQGMVSAPANVSIETFADYFARQFGISGLARAATLRRMQLVQDEYETRDNSPISSAPIVVSGLVTCHTLFPAGDVDHVQFTLDTARSVKIETFNLSNGADTEVQLLTEQGAVVAQNDNATNPRELERGFEVTGCGNRQIRTPPSYMAGINNGVSFSSTVDPIPLSPGTYYISVTSTGARLPSRGTLGSYDLVMTLQ